MQPQVIGIEVIASTVPVSIKGIYIGGDRGFIDAVDESSGKLVWGFDTVASPTLWGNPSVNSGGGSWYPPSFSPKSGLLYVGVANPAPFVGTTQYPNGTSRPGPNLYTDSTVALNISTGKLVWYHQATRTTSLIATSCTRWWSPCPRRAGTRPPDGRRGYRQGRLCHRDGPEDRPAAVAHACRCPQERHHQALTGPTEVLPGHLRRRADPSGVRPRKGIRGHAECARHAVPEPDRVLRGKDRHDARQGRRDGRAHRADLVGHPRSGRPHRWRDRGQQCRPHRHAAGIDPRPVDVDRPAPLEAPGSGGIDGWMSVAGRTIIVPVGDDKPPTILALRLPRT